MRKQWLLLIVVLLASLTLWGCGSSRDSSDVGGTTPGGGIENAELVGNCTICHNILVHTQVNGIAGQNLDPQGLGLAITHDCEACHGGGQFHHGTGPIPYPSPDGARCEVCHEQATKVIASTHNYREQDDPSMVSSRTWSPVCQRCHTAEGFMALKSITGDDGTNDAETVFDDNIVAAGTSPLLPGQLEALDPAGLHNIVCATCHNPLTKKMNTADPSFTPNGSTSAQLALCTSCHFYKFNGGTVAAEGIPYQVSLDAGADGIFFSPVGAVDDTLSAPVTTGVVGHHPDDWYRVIATTHYDNPASNLVIEGYNIRENSENPCFDCHGHELRTNTRRHGTNDPTDPARVETIHTEWAQSPHAGFMLVVKEAAGGNVDEKLAVGVTEDSSPAWIHYNWDDTSTRGACQMCHTATGAANFMNNQVTYDPANNDYSHLEGWAAAGGSPAQEVIYCWTCHTSVDSGAMRDPGAVTLAYINRDVLTPGADLTVDNPITLPDMGNSNVCLNCHSGRGNMTTFLTTTGVTVAADPAGAAKNGGTNTHYYASGATIYQTLSEVGYMYSAQANYADPVYYGHDSLGCAECHMTAESASGQASHTFKVVEKDGTGVVTAIASQKCVECHDGEHALFVAASQVGDTLPIWNGVSAVPTVVTQLMADDAAAELEHEAHGYHNAIDALTLVLTTALTPPQAGYPYFSGTATDQGHGGAMHNWSYLHHEPGGFAHNRFYVKRLLFDSLDWLTSAAGVVQVDPVATPRALDGQITLDPVADAAAIGWFGGDPVTGVCSRP